ncbi:hypothetical protein BJV78DRAFT_1194743 [Lactifluus subvellereus]|nr:hypothetical protein BJV78DRAFT_1194743 [Lactifluus subvellereus]
MGCIPSRQNILEKFDEHGHGRSTLERIPSETKHPKRPKYKAQSRRPPSPVIPEDAPPWVTGHTVMAVHRDPHSGEIYLTEKCR